MPDVIIVGGGLTGGILACALAEKGLDIAMVDERDPCKPLPADSRSFALSQSSSNVLYKLGIWRTLEEVTPITKIHTSDGMLPRWIEYQEKDVKKDALGYVVDSALLKSKILEKVLSFKNIFLYAPSSVVSFERTASSAQIVTHTGEQIKAPLCIAADGKSSSLRTWAQVPLLEWEYNQEAIVCNMTHTLPHENRAFEHFLPSGPLAFVPRPGNESGLVWSIDKEKAAVLLNLSPRAFAEEVRAFFGSSLGNFRLSSRRMRYPLGVCLPKRLIDERLALVGDAAHTFHPVAGQGLNVGFRDVAALAEILSDAFALGLDLGSSTVLDRYQKWRHLDILSMTLLTDGLVRVFSNQNKILARVRAIGFGITKHCSPIKNFMIRHAMGRVGPVPFLAKDE